MLGIIRIVCIKKTPVEMRGPGPAFFLYETSLKKTSYFWYNEIRSNVLLCPKVQPDFFSGRDVFESAALISPSAILDFHSQHSVHSAPGSRMDGMAFCPFRNRNAE